MRVIGAMEPAGGISRPAAVTGIVTALVVCGGRCHAVAPKSSENAATARHRLERDKSEIFLAGLRSVRITSGLHSALS